MVLATVRPSTTLPEKRLDMTVVAEEDGETQ
jgi:hypothetical protein